MLNQLLWTVRMMANTEYLSFTHKHEEKNQKRVGGGGGDPEYYYYDENMKYEN